MDWHLYEELFSKIHALYAANATLVAALSGGLWSPKVKRASDYPYGRYQLISMTPDRWNSGNNPQNAIVQFTFWAREEPRTTLSQTILTAFQEVFNEDGGTRVMGTYASYSFETKQNHGIRADPDDPDVDRLDIDYDVHIMPL